MSQTFTCGCCHQPSSALGSTVERHLGERRRLCKLCGAKRHRRLATVSRQRVRAAKFREAGMVL